MAGPPYPIGVNFWGLFKGDTVWDSPDVFAMAQSTILFDQFGNNAIQATLTAAYVGGSETMQLSMPNGFCINQTAATPTGAVPCFLNSTSGQINFSATTVAGSPWIYPTSWSVPAQDVNYPIGTIVNINRGGGWNNTSTSPANWPLNAEYLDAGRHTGYPTGLNPGQKFLIAPGGYSTIQPGNYTILCPTGKGTGTVSIILASNQTGGVTTTVNINITAGVPASVLTIPIGQSIFQTFVTASSVTDPLYNLRLIMPDRPGHTDNFVATYQAQVNNPFFYMPHPDLVNSLKPFTMVRLMNVLGVTNVPNAPVNWADRPVWNGVGPGIGSATAPYEYIVALVNAVGCDCWWCVPIGYSTDYITNLAAFLLANIPAPRKIALEYANENWNSVFSEYYFMGFRANALNNKWIVSGITYSGGVATVTYPAHGFSTGNTIQISNATDDGYNGAYVITVTSTGTFTYIPSVAPGSSPAVPIQFHPLMAINTASAHYFPISTASWDGHRTITLTTTAANGCGASDYIQICNSVEPAYNGLWLVLTVASNTLTMNFSQSGFSRSMPTNPAAGTVTFAPKAGQSLAIQRVGNVGSPLPDLCNYFLVHRPVHRLEARRHPHECLQCILTDEPAESPHQLPDVADAFRAAAGRVELQHDHQ